MPTRILLVDDNRDATEALALLLEFEGHEVRYACDGGEAFSVVESFVPQVAFIDWNLPDMSGGDVVARLRLNPALSGTRFISLSGLSLPDSQQDAAGAGFEQSITKPATLEQLLACL
ncbi:response regulator [Paraburkholderia kururiensis]|jgi:CheY-like chemotaxis protein|uniref:Response regulator n=1 Tax=Paraburkholderia kururiensis TaxID=984307 RepID=A0ABZ0WEV3_9BURK|nr:response regulator [Paraburkholderia kururiensis]WQD75885.1 response regulator [Paraburkholderia kururiensis]